MLETYLAQMEQTVEQPAAVPKQTTCAHCGEVFETKGKYDAHFRRIHQQKGKTVRGDTILRSENDKFSCVCTKEYDVYQSLVRHQVTCQAWKDRQAEANREESDTETVSEGKTG